MRIAYEEDEVVKLEKWKNNQKCHFWWKSLIPTHRWCSSLQTRCVINLELS